MDPEEYRPLVAELVAAYPPETAARLLERRCHPPLPQRLQRGPRYADAQEMPAARSRGAGAAVDVTEALGDAG
jgi:hypothetical protein